MRALTSTSNVQSEATSEPKYLNLEHAALDHGEKRSPRASSVSWARVRNPTALHCRTTHSLLTSSGVKWLARCCISLQEKLNNKGRLAIPFNRTCSQLNHRSLRVTGTRQSQAAACTASTRPRRMCATRRHVQARTWGTRQCFGRSFAKWWSASITLPTINNAPLAKANSRPRLARTLFDIVWSHLRLQAQLH
jgi:hypothetical protein